MSINISIFVALALSITNVIGPIQSMAQDPAPIKSECEIAKANYENALRVYNMWKGEHEKRFARYEFLVSTTPPVNDPFYSFHMQTISRALSGLAALAAQLSISFEKYKSAEEEYRDSCYDQIVEEEAEEEEDPDIEKSLR